MARMNWKVSFDFKSHHLSKGNLSRKRVFSTKWGNWRLNKDRSFVKGALITPVVVTPVPTIPDPPVSQEAGTQACTTTTEEVVEQKLTKFTCFSNLPVELRCKIWKHAAFIPRNVNIWSSDFGKKICIPLNDNEDEEEGDVLVIWKLCSTTSHPAILSATSESRNEALKHYKLDFGTSYEFRDFTFTTHPRIYFNFDVDRICLMESFEGENSRACKNFFDRMLTNGTRYLALNVKRFQDDTKRECTYVRPFLQRCMNKETRSSLEDIMLLSPEYNREMRGSFEFKDSVELLADRTNINTSILQNLNAWVRTAEKTHCAHETNSRVDVSFRTLMVNGRPCVD